MRLWVLKSRVIVVVNTLFLMLFIKQYISVVIAKHFMSCTYFFVQLRMYVRFGVLQIELYENFD